VGKVSRGCVTDGVDSAVDGLSGDGETTMDDVSGG